MLNFSFKKSDGTALIEDELRKKESDTREGGTNLKLNHNPKAERLGLMEAVSEHQAWNDESTSNQRSSCHICCRFSDLFV